MFALISSERLDLAGTGNPSLDALYKYWEAHRRGRVMPVREDIDLLDIRDGNVGRMHILRVEAPTVFRYVLYGGRVTNPDRVDMTGKTTNEYADRAFGKVVTEHLAGCIREGRPTCYRISADVQGRPYRYIRLVMPLGDARVEYLWVGTQRIEVDPSMDRRRLY